MSNADEIQAIIDAGEKPPYWKGCPSMKGTVDCTQPVGHEGNHSFLGIENWSDDA